MDRMLTSHREREASQSLKALLRSIAGRALSENEEELADIIIHETVEAGADKGRGQIQ